ncbi:putative bifunctional diguanylate cyclase/phosphodiesterase [Bacillus sp. SCS-153A]|uniref:putative bifunctional diguanylate cyclase/phosphodiesterase n=1 Tax=Rossellomorea sedimentorum TaxID=3115294 RepID=UPI0039069C60
MQSSVETDNHSITPAKKHLTNVITSPKNIHKIFTFSLKTFELITYPEQGKYFAGQTFLGLLGKNDKDQFRSAVQQLIDGELNISSFYAEIKMSERSRAYAKIQLQLIQHNKQTCCIALVNDRYPERTSEEVVYLEGVMDTESQKVFYKRLQDSINLSVKTGALVSVLILDLDRFKNINHSLGRRYGDEILNLIPQRLQAHIRQNDGVIRLEGDQFLCVFKNVRSVADVAQIADRLLESFCDPFQVEGYELFLTPSIGVSTNNGENCDAESLIMDAEKAMYKAKESGGNCYQFYNKAMNSSVLERLVLENHLRKAIEFQEFVLYYQPLIDARTNKITSLEALIRWNHPTRGILSPAEFIPFAEEIGLIGQIGEWVIKEACRQLKQWHDLGFTSLSMSVNLSAQQFKDEHLQEKLMNILKENGLSPEFINLEITETSAMEYSNKFKNIFNNFKHTKLKIHLDDFGVGYSSLSYLKQWTIDTLKIDRSFIKELVLDSDNREIVTAIINLAHALGIKVIAEGVETESQLEILNSLGCDALQGYYISVPLAKEEMSRYLVQYQKAN